MSGTPKYLYAWHTIMKGIAKLSMLVLKIEMDFFFFYYIICVFDYLEKYG